VRSVINMLRSVKFAECKVLTFLFSMKKILKWSNSESNPNSNPNFHSRLIR